MRTGSKNNSLSQEYRRKWGLEGGELAGTYGERDTRSDPWLSPSPHIHVTHTHTHRCTHALTLTHASSLTQTRLAQVHDLPVMAERPLVTTLCTPQLWLKWHGSWKKGES